MDSMVNRYTSDSGCAATMPTHRAARAARPDRSVIVYAQRAREAYRDVPIIIGGIEASLRRIAHFDYWSEKVRRSMLLDAKADMLVYGNGERQIMRDRARLAAGEPFETLTRPARHRLRAPRAAGGLDRDRLDAPGCARPAEPPIDPYAATPARAAAPADGVREQVVRFARRVPNADRERSVIRMPSYEAGGGAIRCCTRTPRASCTWNPIPAMRARWCSAMATQDVWLNPPPIPLSTEEMDWIYDLPYQRRRIRVRRRRISRPTK
jgi:radical SAM superfamily enzyme YgiQ (UPF0313 family)